MNDRASWRSSAGKSRHGQGQAQPKREAPMKLTPLGDDRFQELVRGASAFFANAERDVEAEKAQAIKEIQALMAQYQLSTADLAD